MKVLIVSDDFPSSREQVFPSPFILAEASELSTRGIEICVARGTKSVLNEKKHTSVDGISVRNFCRKIDGSIVPVSLNGVRELAFTNLFDPKVVLAVLPYSWFIVKLVKESKIDLIHAHFAFPEGFSALLAKNSVGKPLVVTLHGYDIITEPSVGYGVRLKRRYDIMVRKVLSEADVVFAASNYVYQEALKAGCDKQRLVYLPNGVDLARFNPDVDGSFLKRKFGLSNCPVIFTLRGHVPRTGLEYLIRAVPLVLREMPNAIFMIGGEGPLRMYHKRLVNELGISQHVYFAGHIPFTLLPKYYGLCDVFVIPSVMEAFGLVTVEAMACGKPVVGTNVGGIPDTIVDEVNGFLVKPKNPAEIAEKIIKLVQNPEIRRQMGARGRKVAEDRFDIQKRIDKIVDVYSDLLVA